MFRSLFTTTAVLAVSATTALAGSIEVSATGHGKGSNEVMQVSDGLMVVNAGSTYEHIDTSDPDSPLASLTGDCFGSMVIKAGVPTGGGHCHYTDADGDVVVMGWTPTAMSAEGRTTGEWRVEGGTGKWASASGGGAFDAGTDAAGMYSNKITGELMMP